MSRRKIIKNHYYEMKAHASKIFPTYYDDKFQKWCQKIFFKSIFFCKYEKSRNLWRELGAKNTIFFKKLKSMSKHLKNSFWQMKPTSYRYLWTSFHYGINGYISGNVKKVEILKKWSSKWGSNILTKPHVLSWNFFSKVSRNFFVDFTDMFKVSERSSEPRRLRQ